MKRRIQQAWLAFERRLAALPQLTVELLIVAAIAPPMLAFGFDRGPDLVLLLPDGHAVIADAQVDEGTIIAILGSMENPQ